MLQRSLLSALVLLLALQSASAQVPDGPQLPDTTFLDLEEPLDVAMARGINLFAERELEASPALRDAAWKRDFSSIEAYVASVAPHRERLAEIIGAADERIANPRMYRQDGSLYMAEYNSKLWIANAVRMEVLPGVHLEGMLAVPEFGGPAPVCVILIPDADTTPEALLGVSDDLPAEGQIGARLVEAGAMVFIPDLINRDIEFSGHPNTRFTNMTHREYVYRVCFELGSHVVGLEVQKLRSALDYVKSGSLIGLAAGAPVVVWGVGEGGLLAMLTSALDDRVDITVVSGYFQQREQVWREPIYRNIWDQLSEFGDAEIAGLIAPRRLIIDTQAAPEDDGIREAIDGRAAIAAPGRIVQPSDAAVQAEFERAVAIFEEADASAALALTTDFIEIADHLRDWTDVAYSPSLETRSQLLTSTEFEDPHIRQARQIGELVRYSQDLLQFCDKVRDQLWSGADRTSVDTWAATSRQYRDLVHDEMIGRLAVPDCPLNPRSRQVIDTPTHVGYEVVLDVYPAPADAANEPIPEGEPTGIANGRNDLDHTVGPDWGVIAGGILLIPKDLQPGEQRPVVVCQHGLEGRPMSTITTDETSGDWGPYKGFSTALVERGFIVYAPQNPYRGTDDFRVIQRKSNPLGRSLFSYIIEQHRQTLRWLGALPYVDRDRIGFYGLSYGGKTAVRVPPLLVAPEGSNDPEYCLSICSADFNEWVRKNCSAEDRYSYVYTPEYEIFEWNMGHVANYAELSNLMTPRPFMVERGHFDGVAPDEWVGWEFAKVQRHYDLLGIGENAEIEWFTGPHTINGVGTYDFLHRHLNWPVRDAE